MQTRHSTESSHETDEFSAATPRASASTPPMLDHETQQRPPAFTTINNTIGPGMTRITSLPVAGGNGMGNRSFVNVDIPVSAIAGVIEAERNSLIERLTEENNAIRVEHDELKANFASLQAKYTDLEDQLTTKMQQIQEILGGKAIGKDFE